MPEPTALSALQRMNVLFDCYGDLLTKKQRACFIMHYMDDLSLAETGVQLGVTPQAVADLLKRTVALLDGYESALHLMQKHETQTAHVRYINEALDALASDGADEQQLSIIRSSVHSMINA